MHMDAKVPQSLCQEMCKTFRNAHRRAEPCKQRVLEVAKVRNNLGQYSSAESANDFRQRPLVIAAHFANLALLSRHWGSRVDIVIEESIWSTAHRIPVSHNHSIIVIARSEGIC